MCERGKERKCVCEEEKKGDRESACVRVIVFVRAYVNVREFNDSA